MTQVMRCVNLTTYLWLTWSKIFPTDGILCAKIIQWVLVHALRRNWRKKFDVLVWYFIPPLDGADNPKIYSMAFCEGEV